MIYEVEEYFIKKNSYGDWEVCFKYDNGKIKHHLRYNTYQDARNRRIFYMSNPIVVRSHHIYGIDLIRRNQTE